MGHINKEYIFTRQLPPTRLRTPPPPLPLRLDVRAADLFTPTVTGRWVKDDMYKRPRGKKHLKGYRVGKIKTLTCRYLCVFYHVADVCFLSKKWWVFVSVLCALMFFWGHQMEANNKIGCNFQLGSLKKTVFANT